MPNAPQFSTHNTTQPTMTTIPTNDQANACYPVIHRAIINVAPNEHGMLCITSRPRALQRCEICIEPTLQRCSLCHRTAYCSKEHQAQDWSQHKGRYCREVRRKYQSYLSAMRNCVAEFNRTMTTGSCSTSSAIPNAVEFSYMFTPKAGAKIRINSIN